MRLLLLFLPLVACSPGKVAIGDDTATETDTDTDTDGDTDTDTDTDTDATAVGDCEVDPSLAVLSVDTAPIPGLELATELTVELSGSAAIGVACRRDGSPEDLLYFTSDAATTHTLDLYGFAPDGDYTCAVAPVCPRMSAQGERFTVSTGAAPATLPGLDVETHPTLAPTGGPYLLMNSGPCSIDGSPTYLAMYDFEGVPRWYLALPSGLWADVVGDYLGGGEISWGGGFSTEGYPRRVDMRGDVLTAAAWDGSTRITFTHEGHVIDDERFLSFAWVTNTRGRESWDGFEIYISNTDDELEWSWNTQTASDAGLLPSGRNADSHGNWAKLVTRDDGTERVYASACYLDTIMAIDKASGELAWRLGPDGDFGVVDADGEPLGDEGYPDCQHGVEVEGDTLLVYDNGMDRSYSRVVEYQLDEASMTATLAWSWTEDGWDTDWLGDADYLPGDHVLLTQGEQDCAWSGGEDVKSRITEVDRATGEVVWRGTFDTDNNLTYRSEREDACDVLPNTRWCPDAAAAYAEVAGLFP